ncbi:MAG TPA: insulinase family protein, partial [Thermoanaerobaculia bacterium]
MNHASRRGPAALGSLLFLMAAMTAAAAPAPPEARRIEPGSAYQVDVEYSKLPNGLKVVLSRDTTAPVAVVAVYYNIGFRIEPKDRTGFAHLFEHMMFKGSENVGPGEHFYTIFSNGGTMNGTTNKERTLYYEELPSNQLDMALFLEADRMR